LKIFCIEFFQITNGISNKWNLSIGTNNSSLSKYTWKELYWDIWKFN